MVDVEDPESVLVCDLTGTAAIFPPNSSTGGGLDLGRSFMLSSFSVVGKLNRVRRKLEGRELKITKRCQRDSLFVH